MAGQLWGSWTAPSTVVDMGTQLVRILKRGYGCGGSMADEESMG